MLFYYLRLVCSPRAPLPVLSTNRYCASAMTAHAIRQMYEVEAGSRGFRA